MTVCVEDIDAFLHAIGLARRKEGRRVLIVGAGRAGRSLVRELRETPDERVVGFLDDDPAVRGRRVNGVKVFGGLQWIDAALDRTKPDVVLITVPQAAADRLTTVISACELREIDCRVIRREIDVDPRVILEPHTR